MLLFYITLWLPDGVPQPGVFGRLVSVANCLHYIHLTHGFLSAGSKSLMALKSVTKLVRELVVSVLGGPDTPDYCIRLVCEQRTNH